MVACRACGCKGVMALVAHKVIKPSVCLYVLGYAYGKFYIPVHARLQSFAAKGR
jgi:hypothetical protein